MNSFGRGSAFELLIDGNKVHHLTRLFELFLTIKYYFSYDLSSNIDLHVYAVYTHSKVSFSVRCDLLL